MTTRRWFLAGIFVALGLTYIVLFTEWLRPEPIEIASQVRFTIQPPRFGVPLKKPLPNATVTQPQQIVRADRPGQAPQSAPLVQPNQIERIGRPAKGEIDQAPGGVANVTFSLDDTYNLTAIRVEDVPVDGTMPNVLWRLSGKSRPVRSLLYGRNPQGMTNLAPVEPLKPGVPYRLILEAGRRRGIHNFTTSPALRPAE